MEYKKMYSVLFNAITDAMRELQRGYPDLAYERLRAAQLKTEEMYIEADGEE